MKMGTLDWIAWILVMIGALNWGLVGFFQYDLVAQLFGGMDRGAARTIYSLVGLSALYMVFMMPKMGK